jgi:hypothetical protein
MITNISIFDISINNTGLLNVNIDISNNVKNTEYIESENTITDNTNTNTVKKRKRTRTKTNIKHNIESITYKNYCETEYSLSNYKIPELKLLAKNNKLKITGNKTILIQRIEEHYIKIKRAIYIQAFFRGYIVRSSFILRGPGLFKRSICVNETDFYTMEPLSEIDFKFFYSFCDANNFIYGFDIMSLRQLMKNKSKSLNPYNREQFTQQQKNNILSLYYKIKIIFINDIQQFYPEILRIDDSILSMMNASNTTGNNIQNNVTRRTASRRLVNQILIVPTNVDTGAIQNNMINQTDPTFLGLNLQSSMVDTNILSISQMNDIIQKVREIRSKPTATRIMELFIEVDILGNYTQSSWFTELDRIHLIHLYRHLYDIWIHRSQMTNQTRSYIYPIGNLFRNLVLPSQYRIMTREQIELICLDVMENMVYYGIDIEYRKIGTLHMLSALTVVSRNARIALPWLYESVS